MVIIDKVLDDIERLPLDDQEFIEQELHKRIINLKRDEIFNQSKKIDSEIKNGKYTEGSVDDFLMDINK